METNRRSFLGASALMAGGALLTSFDCEPGKMPAYRASGKGLKLTWKPYDLQLRHTFTIASNSRKTTAVVLTQLEWEGVIGYGEGSMPPYLGESHETAQKFLSALKLDQFRDPFRMEEILDYVDQIMPGNCAAKASVDIALHDLVGKLLNQPWHRIWGYSKENTPLSTFTIGIDKGPEVVAKTKEASAFKILKVKIGGGNDEEMINSVRSVTQIPLCVDVNQGWKERQEALDKVHWLKEQGIVFIEQPFDKHNLEDTAWLTQHSPLPILADEAMQRVGDLKKLQGVYSGINCKLMKCTGMREAHKILETARSLNMKTLMGCMTETSCGTSAAAQLSPIVDWADLDGNLLISNDLYEGMKIVEGKIVLSDLPGIGIRSIG
ncbi:MAG: dipeptide epimerase [Marinilabiliales bacterium]|nr:dipeptide epimerase [Marinilabiliales bacterium]